MKKILLLTLLLTLLGRSTPAQAQLPGPCAGTVYPNLGHCVPPSGQNPWLAEWADFALKVDQHAGNTATPHGATSVGTPSRLLMLNASGNFAANLMTGNITGNAGTANALLANPAGCATNEFAFDSQANGALVCAPLGDANIPDNITVSSYLSLGAGSGQPLLGPLYLSTQGINYAATNTVPACTAGVYGTYARLSEGKLKKCENGVLSDFGSGVGGSGDITGVLGCLTGDCSALTAVSGDTLDMGAATSSRPTTRSTTLPGTSVEGQWHQDTDSGGSETYVATATNSFVKLATTTDTAPLATALAANGANCSAGNAPLGVDASGAVESCTDYATQTELNSHTALTNPHGATTNPTADTIKLRDSLGGERVKFTRDTVATLPVCNATNAHTETVFMTGRTSTDCGVDGDGFFENTCYCNGTSWAVRASGGGSSTLQSAYNLETNPTINSNANGLLFTGFNSFAKSSRICEAGQCERRYIDGSGVLVITHDLPLDLIWKAYPAKTIGWLTSGGLPSLTSSAAGAMTVATSLIPTGSGFIRANRTPCTGTDYLKFDGTCAAAGGGGATSVTVLDKQVGDTATTNPILASNTAKVIIYSFAVPANTLGTDKCIEVTVKGTITNNIAAGQTVTARYEYIGTESVASAITSVGTTARAVRFVLELCGNNSTALQRQALNWDVNGSTAASVSSAPAENSTVGGNLILSLQFTGSGDITYTPRTARAVSYP